MELNNGEMFNEAKELARYLVENGKELAMANADNIQKVIEIDGIPFMWDAKYNKWTPVEVPLPYDEPTPKPLTFYTLDGLIDYILTNVEGTIPSGESDEKLIIQVVNWQQVVLWSKPSKHRKQRHVIASVEAHTPNIQFGYHMDNETFCTMLLSDFIDTEARASLFKVVKCLTNEQSLRTADDGVSQVVTVKQGVTLAADVKFENPVPLKPMRTFTEIDQPESNFTLRIDEKARPALFEADGGAWKNAAVASIKQYLTSNLFASKVVVLA